MYCRCVHSLSIGLTVMLPMEDDARMMIQYNSFSRTPTAHENTTRNYVYPFGIYSVMAVVGCKNERA